MIPEIFASPITSNLLVGAVLLIPKLPPVETRTFSKPPISNCNGCPELGVILFTSIAFAAGLNEKAPLST